MGFPLFIPFSLALAVIKATIKNDYKKKKVKEALLQLAAIIHEAYGDD